MKVIEHKLYLQDVRLIAEEQYPWEKLCNKSILISGATGMLGTFLVDVLCYRNIKHEMNCTIYVICRNEFRAKELFSSFDKWVKIIVGDINEPIHYSNLDSVDYVIHLASNTHPAAYANNPIETILTNIIGTKNMLDCAFEHKAIRCLFASSVEIYGENSGDVDSFDEKYCGYIDSNTLRAGYPESKRCGEALCQAYIAEKGLDIVIARIARVYGPTVLAGDTKAVSQFISNGVNSEDIVLKSQGNQFFSYIYMSDAISGILTVLFSGVKGCAYNISDEKSDIRLKDMAKIIANYNKKRVVYDIPSKTEVIGSSKVTNARLNSNKLKALGWRAFYDIEKGIKRTLDILRESKYIK